jgi:phage terminase large subunit GpA-like protein
MQSKILSIYIYVMAGRTHEAAGSRYHLHFGKTNRSVYVSALMVVHFPEYNTEYFKQLTAEQLVKKIVKGYPKRIWQKIRDRNEALDCRVYARAAAIALGIDRWSESKWEQLSGKSLKKNIEKIEDADSQISNKKTLDGKPRIIRSRWL